jgi:uncharacterized protein
MDFAPIFIERPVLSVTPILAMAYRLGIEVRKAHDLHVTVIFSRRPVSWCAATFLPDPSPLLLSSQTFRFARFGLDGSILVMKLESRELQSRHRHLLAAGALWDHEDYQPHITLGSAPSHELPIGVQFQDRIMLGPEVRKTPKPELL